MTFVQIIQCIRVLNLAQFFPFIWQLAQAPETAPLGLMLIQTAFEEFTSPREDLAVTRKEELHRLMLEQVPVVLNILSGNCILINI